MANTRRAKLFSGTASVEKNDLASRYVRIRPYKIEIEKITLLQIAERISESQSIVVLQRSYLLPFQKYFRFQANLFVIDFTFLEFRAIYVLLL